MPLTDTEQIKLTVSTRLSAKAKTAPSIELRLFDLSILTYPLYVVCLPPIVLQLFPVLLRPSRRSYILVILSSYSLSTVLSIIMKYQLSIAALAAASVVSAGPIKAKRQAAITDSECSARKREVRTQIRQILTPNSGHLELRSYSGASRRQVLP